MTKEATILAYAKRLSKQLDFEYIRLAFLPGTAAGWPDVMVLGNDRAVLWVETKALGKPLEPLQVHRRDTLLARGHHYCKPDSKEAVEKALTGFAEYCIALGNK